MTKKRHSFKDWLLATRPWSFPASAMPVLVTLVYLYWSGYGQMDWLAGVWALVNIVLFHAAGNTWSDYFDYKKGVDTPQTHGATTLTSGQFAPGEIKWLSISLLLVALFGGIGLMLMTGWPLFWYGVGGALCVLLYPFLKYRALGDVVIAMAYAWLPCWGTSYVATGAVDMRVWLLALPLGCITVAILHVNNTRDVRTDAEAHITTLAMKLGHTISSRLYQFYLLFPFACLVACVVFGLFPPLALVALLALPLAWGNVRMMDRSSREDTSVISLLDERTAQLQLVFSLLLSLSLVISSLFS